MVQNKTVYVLQVSGDIAYHGGSVILETVKISSDRDSLQQECDRLNSEIEDEFSEQIENEDDEYEWEGFVLTSLPEYFVSEFVVE